MYYFFLKFYLINFYAKINGGIGGNYGVGGFGGSGGIGGPGGSPYYWSEERRDGNGNSYTVSHCNFNFIFLNL